MARLSDSITYGNHAITGDVSVGGDETVDGNLTIGMKVELSENWDATNVDGNAIFNRENNRGFAFGNGSGVSTWFTYDGTLRRAIDCYNNGSKITLHNDAYFNGNLYVPSRIYHDGDTNTYIQFHAADQWRVVTGGVQRLEVNNSQTTISGGSESSALVISDDAPTMKFNDTGAGGDDFYIHINANRFYILTDRGDDGSWESPHPLEIDNDTGVMQLYGNTVWHSGNDGSGSGLDADLLDGQHASAFAAASHSHDYLGSTAKAADSNLLDGINSSSFLRSDTTDYLTGLMYVRGDIRNEDAYRDHGIYGHYSSSKINHIWSMGSAYRVAANGANFGDLYGLAYKHTNNTTGGTMAGSHQMVWCHNGTGKSAMGSGIWTSGNVTAYSDIRVKTNIEVIPEALDKISSISGYTFDRTDVEYDEEGEPMTPIRQTGVIAQELLEVLPEAVTGGPTEKDPDGHYSVAYGNLVGLLIEGIKEERSKREALEDQLLTQDERITRLEELLNA